MSDNQVVIGFDIYERTIEYDHDQYYDYCEDANGQLIKPHYGHDGDGDWYITCYENITTKEYGYHNDIKFYYKWVGRVPFEIIYNFNWKEVEGLILSFQDINGESKPCFVKYKENKCYVVTK